MVSSLSHSPAFPLYVFLAALLCSALMLGPQAQANPSPPSPSDKKADADKKQAAEAQHAAQQRYEDLKSLWGFTPLGAVMNGSDISRHGISNTMTFKSSTGYTLNDPGPVWTLALSSALNAPGKTANLRDVDPLYYERQVSGAFMLGWQTSVGQTYVATYLGAQAAHEARPEENRIRRRYGPRFQLEVWSNPLKDTMATAVLAVESAKGSLWTRGRLGYDLFGLSYIGPEGSIYHERNYQQYRGGLHITGPTIWTYSFEVSGGVFHDTDGRRGGYGALLMMRKL